MTIRTAFLSILLFSTLALGCAPVKFHQKRLLSNRMMIFNFDHAAHEMRGHMISPREGSVGGFNSVNAGGCSCK